MQELRVIGVEDGALVAASDEGARFRIEIDEVLQSRIRHAAPVVEHGPRPSPRDVQAHIRSGLSAEEVAELTGASVEYLRRYEGPVLAEREHMVTSALAVPVHGGEATEGVEPASFGGMVRERLGQLGAHGERWASWKDPERGWMVKLEFTADGIDHDARWSFEPRKRALHPQNSDASTLSKLGEVRGGMIPRLRAVSADDEQSRFDSGAFTFEASDIEHDDTAPQPDLTATRAAVSGPSSSAAVTRAAIKRADEPAPPSGETADLLEALRRRRGERETSPGERMAPPSPLAPSSDSGTFSATAATSDLSELAAPPVAPTAAALPTDADQASESRSGAAARALWGGASKASPPQRAKKGRAAMPSWDEIVFGARSDDDLA